MIKTKIIRVDKEVPDIITCDFCGTTLKKFDVDFWEGTHFTLDFGYHSKFDTEKWEFDICDECAEKLKEKKLI
jgi:protein-arginine kinase activator protein McsA